MAHSAAFQCAKCPENNDPAKGPSCPNWWSTVHTNITSGDLKIVASCGFEQLPMYLIEVIKASNRPAAAVESTRNEMVRGFALLASSDFAGLIQKRLAEAEEQPALTNGAELDRN